MNTKPVWALGLMSGTSMDGIDAALLETDGETVRAIGATLSAPYSDETRSRIRAVLGAREADDQTAEIERELTLLHGKAVRNLLNNTGMKPDQVSVIGFHGQTITHDPVTRFTWQIGDGALLAAETGMDVVSDFRSADVVAGGEGAPFAPAYHQAIAAEKALPVVILNLGGVGNVTWLAKGMDPIAFDTGPANALLDDWVSAHAGIPYDEGGTIAAAGTVKEEALAQMLRHPYFDRPPPKSLDRNDFSIDAVSSLSLEDGAATLAAFTVESVARSPFPEKPLAVYVTGGGRKNAAIMKRLSKRMAVPVAPIEEIGFDGDALEAQAFAFLAVRHLRGLPTSYPSTTGIPQPICGGRFFRKSETLRGGTQSAA